MANIQFPYEAETPLASSTSSPTTSVPSSSLCSSPAMDRLESLGTQLSQITMYDIKSYYNQVRNCGLRPPSPSRDALMAGGWSRTLQAKNMVLNVSEMEAKVREATNEDPW
jgi:hypothetical protein